MGVLWRFTRSLLVNSPSNQHLDELARPPRNPLVEPVALNRVIILPKALIRIQQGDFLRFGIKRVAEKDARDVVASRSQVLQHLDDMPLVCIALLKSARLSTAQ
jgi:hypothetical protein